MEGGGETASSFSIPPAFDLLLSQVETWREKATESERVLLVCVLNDGKCSQSFFFASSSPERSICCTLPKPLSRLALVRSLFGGGGE